MYSYDDIFKVRGDSYNLAMERYPLARINDFVIPLSFAKFSKGSTYCDIPSGGGYVRPLIDKDVSIISIESSMSFNHVASNGDRLIKAKMADDIPLRSASVDGVISIAGLHHIEDKRRIIKEFSRIIRPGGELIIMDVSVSCITAEWLNDFVNRNNSMGHEGVFLNHDFVNLVRQSGFNVEMAEKFKYQWEFSSTNDMVDFCRLLFGLDLASDEDIEMAISEYLGYEESKNGVGMNWESFVLVGHLD